MTRKTKEERFTQYFGVEATGHRIGLVSCLACGATIIIGDEDFDACQAHIQWHLGRRKFR